MQKLSLMAGSLRKDSVNKKLIHVVEAFFQEKHMTNYSVISLNDFECPLYNEDDEVSKGIPKDIQKYNDNIINDTHLIFALPEYNGMMPGVFKNFFDWVSRVRPMPWANKKILLISASPSGFGGMRGFLHNRIPFESCGAFVYPKSFFLSDAYSCFDQQNNLKSKEKNKTLSDVLEEFLEF